MQTSVSPGHQQRYSSEIAGECYSNLCVILFTFFTMFITIFITFVYNIHNMLTMMQWCKCRLRQSVSNVYSTMKYNLGSPDSCKMLTTSSALQINTSSSTMVELERCSFVLMSSHLDVRVQMLYALSSSGVCNVKMIQCTFSKPVNSLSCGYYIFKGNNVNGASVKCVMEGCHVDMCNLFICVNNTNLIAQSKCTWFSGSSVVAHPLCEINLKDCIVDYSKSWEPIIQTWVDDGTCDNVGCMKAFIVSVENLTLILPEDFSSLTHGKSILLSHSDKFDGGKDRIPQLLFSMLGSFNLVFHTLSCASGDDLDKTVFMKLRSLCEKNICLLQGKGPNGDAGSSWSRLFVFYGSEMNPGSTNIQWLDVSAGMKASSEVEFKKWFQTLGGEAFQGLSMNVHGFDSQSKVNQRNWYNQIMCMFLQPKWNSLENFMLIRNKSQYASLKEGILVCEKIRIAGLKSSSCLVSTIVISQDVILTTPVDISSSVNIRSSGADVNGNYRKMWVVAGSCFVNMGADDNDKYFKYDSLFRVHGESTVCMKGFEVLIVPKNFGNVNMWMLPLSMTASNRESLNPAYSVENYVFSLFRNNTNLNVSTCKFVSLGGENTHTAIISNSMQAMFKDCLFYKKNTSGMFQSICLMGSNKIAENLKKPEVTFLNCELRNEDVPNCNHWYMGTGSFISNIMAP